MISLIARFNAFDWFLVILVGYSTLSAFRSGLVRAIFGLLGIGGGFWIAASNYRTVGDWIAYSRLKLPLSTDRIIAFLVIVVAVAMTMEWIGRVVHRFLRTVGLGWFDRLLGMAFGLARGCILGLGALMAACAFIPQSEFLTGSALTPYLFEFAHEVSFLVPQYLQELMVGGAIDFTRNMPH